MGLLTTFLVRLSMGNGRTVNGQVRTVLFGGQVKDLDPFLVNSCNLSRAGQVRLAVSDGQVGNIDPSGVNLKVLIRSSYLYVCKFLWDGTETYVTCSAHSFPLSVCLSLFRLILSGGIGPLFLPYPSPVSENATYDRKYYVTFCQMLFWGWKYPALQLCNFSHCLPISRDNVSLNSSTVGRNPSPSDPPTYWASEATKSRRNLAFFVSGHRAVRVHVHMTSTWGKLRGNYKSRREY